MATKKPAEARWPPPWYPTFSADMMAKEHYKLASLAEHGLLRMVMDYCWWNDGIPADHGDMARLLGVARSDVQANMGPLFKMYVKPMPGHADRLYVPELHEAQGKMWERRLARAAAGSKGGAATKQKKQSSNAVGDAGGEAGSNAAGNADAPAASKSAAPEVNGTDPKRSHPDKNGHEQFLKDLEDDEERRAIEQFDGRPGSGASEPASEAPF